MRMTLYLLVLVVSVAAPAQKLPAPIIDMHLHATTADSNGPPPLAICAPGVGFPALDPKQNWGEVFIGAAKKPPCSNPIWSPTTNEEIMNRTIAILKKRNIVGVTSGPLIDQWREPGGERIIPGLLLSFTQGAPSPEEMRRLFQSGKYKVLAEVAIQYDGLSPSDEKFEPYLAVAEELDIPVGIHIGTGPPGAPYLFAPNYRARLHSPLLLEDAIVRHPKVRVYIMHAGWPMLDDLLALMWTYPQVYVDTGVISFVLPRREFHHYLQRIVEAGFGKRVMFGSDQMNWPEAIEKAIESIETAEFLTAEQKRDILYNNAARFLRLSEAEIARHHGK